MNINNLLKRAHTVLVTDCDNYHKDISNVNSLADVRSELNLVFTSRLIKIGECSNRITYRLVNSMYKFELTIID